MRTSHIRQREEVASTKRPDPMEAHTSAAQNTLQPEAHTRQAAVLRMQQRYGNQYVQRMLASGDPLGGIVRRDEDDDGMGVADGAGSSVGGEATASNFDLGKLLGVDSIPDKVKEVVTKTQGGVNKGLDWLIEQVQNATS